MGKRGPKIRPGALLVTQQPGSLPNEILSQGDNWFIFHLLSAADLVSAKRANAHFSDDLLSSLLNEPITGQGVFWSSVGGKPYPIPMRVLSFEKLYAPLDPTYDRSAVSTFATTLRIQDETLREEARTASTPTCQSSRSPNQQSLFPEIEEPVDIEELYRSRAVQGIRGDAALLTRIDGGGAPWRAVIAAIEGALPNTVDDKNAKAADLTPYVLYQIYGQRDSGWHAYRNEKGVLYVKKGPPS